VSADDAARWDALAKQGQSLQWLAGLSAWAKSVQKEEEGDGGVPSAPEAQVSGVIVIPDSPVASEDGGGGETGEQGLEVVQGELVGGDSTEEDSVEEGIPVVIATAVPLSSEGEICQLPGCELPVYVATDGRRYEYCCHSHGRRHLRPTRAQHGETCKLLGCDKKVRIDTDGTPFEFCCRSHGRDFQRLKEAVEGSSQVERELVGAGSAVVGPAGGSEFSPESEIVCVVEGCFKPVKRPHAGASGGRLGYGPIRYNFCSRQCKDRHGRGEGTIPFSTVCPLRDAWYRGTVEASQQLWREVFEEVMAAGESGAEPEGGEDSAAGSQEEHGGIKFTPPPVSSFSAEQVSSVMRCRGLMTRLMASRRLPYQAQWNGKTRCALCSQCFKKGVSMVRCYVDPVPHCRWVHVDCAQAIVTANGGRLLHPSLV